MSNTYYTKIGEFAHDFILDMHAKLNKAKNGKQRSGNNARMSHRLKQLDSIQEDEMSIPEERFSEKTTFGKL